MNRHVRQSCKIANSDEGMEKLMDHTIQRQMSELRAQNARMEAQMSELAAILKGQTIPVAQSASIKSPAVVNTGPVFSAKTILHQTINIIPWDGERKINVGVAQMAAAFIENARLKEYASFDDHQRTDPELAPPYVAELLMDLVKRGHADPTSRNVYLNPRRADQALVHLRSGRWEVVALQEATRLLFDGVAQTIHQVILSYEERKQLPTEAQNALSLAGLMYEDEPEEYVRRAKNPMAAHLANTSPGTEKIRGVGIKAAALSSI